MTDCKNCDTAFEGKFCPKCSQSANVHRLTTGHIIHEIAHGITHFDTGALHLLRKVIYVPGRVAKEYIDGKRKRYFNPFTLLILLLAGSVVASNKTNINGDFIQSMKRVTTALIVKTGKSSTAEKDKKIREIGREMDDAENSTKKATDSSKLINFFFLPVVSLLTWIFFKNSKYNYAENLVLNLFIACGYTAVFLAAINLYIYFSHHRLSY